MRIPPLARLEDYGSCDREVSLIVLFVFPLFSLQCTQYTELRGRFVNVILLKVAFRIPAVLNSELCRGPAAILDFFI